MNEDQVFKEIVERNHFGCSPTHIARLKACKNGAVALLVTMSCSRCTERLTILIKKTGDDFSDLLKAATPK